MSDRRRRAQRRVVEAANRKVAYPEGLSLFDGVCYRAVTFLGTLQLLILRRLVKEQVWRSSNGRVRRICDLDDRHLNNIVHMIERGASDVDDYVADAV